MTPGVTLFNFLHHRQWYIYPLGYRQTKSPGRRNLQGLRFFKPRYKTIDSATTLASMSQNYYLSFEMKNKLLQFFAFISLAALIWYAMTNQKPPEPIEKDKEQEYIRQLNQKQAEIKRLQARYDSISWKMYNDSLIFEARLKTSNDQINRLKRNAQKINLKTANPTALDSLTTSLYPEPR